MALIAHRIINALRGQPSELRLQCPAFAPTDDNQVLRAPETIAERILWAEKFESVALPLGWSSATTLGGRFSINHAPRVRGLVRGIGAITGSIDMV
jgi:hypothetical protein